MTDYESLPAELRAELKTERNADFQRQLAIMFADGKQRTINEALVDYWKQHQTVIKRGSMTQALADMAKNGSEIRRAGKGVYVTTKESRNDIV